MADADALFWLRVMAVASALQVTILCAALVTAFVLVRRAQARLEEWQRQHIAPVAARAQAAIDVVNDVAQRFRAIDDDVRHAIGRAGDRMHQTGAKVRAPIVGLFRGARAAIATLAFGRDHRGGTPVSSPLSAQDRDDRGRFSNEGGAQHAHQ